MKLIVATVFAILAVASAVPVEEQLDWVDIDWSNVVPIEETPGFWEGREVGPAFYDNEDGRMQRIVGGAIVTPGAHPYQAGLLMQTGGGQGLCGGSIISARTVLTAAHCPDNTVSTIVILGAHTLQATEATQQRITAAASWYRIHGSYNRQNLNNDIATIQLPSAITAHARRASIALAPATSGTFAGVLATVSGWGRISNTGGTSAQLRSMQNNVITNAVCQQSFGGIIIASTICLSNAGGRSTCNGDSGGPVTVANGGSRLQVGIVSFGSAAGCTNAPSGHARVSSFRAWITSNTI